MAASPEFRMTPAELCTELRQLGHDIKPRRLTYWGHKGVLPRLDNIGKGKGGGRGALWAWRDPDIVLRAHTVCAAMKEYPRTRYALLLAWFAGFDYPADVPQAVWASHEERQWRTVLAEAVGGEDPDAPEAELIEAVGPLLQMLPARAAHQAFNRAYARAAFDPNFAGISAADGALVADDIVAMRERRGDLVIPPGWVERAFSLYHSELSPVTLRRRIASASPQELEAAHRDVACLMGASRWLLRSVIDEGKRRGEANEMYLWLLPRLAWKLGRQILVVDLALRLNGYSAEVDASMRCFRQLSASPAFRAGAQALRTNLAALPDIQRGDPGAMPPVLPDSIRAACGPGSDVDQGISAIEECGAELVAIWSAPWWGLVAAVSEGRQPARS